MVCEDIRCGLISELCDRAVSDVLAGLLIIRPEELARIEDVAASSGLPRAVIMRRLIEAVYREVLLRGYRPAEGGDGEWGVSVVL